jgi:hypothetical protein
LMLSRPNSAIRSFVAINRKSLSGDFIFSSNDDMW